MEEIKKKKQELYLVTAKIRAGREKNLRRAKNLRLEIARMMTKMNIKKEVKK
jgi:hypothetical protein